MNPIFYKQEIDAEQGPVGLQGSEAALPHPAHSS